MPTYKSNPFEYQVMTAESQNLYGEARKSYSREKRREGAERQPQTVYVEDDSTEEWDREHATRAANRKKEKNARRKEEIKQQESDDVLRRKREEEHYKKQNRWESKWDEHRAIAAKYMEAARSKKSQESPSSSRPTRYDSNGRPSNNPTRSYIVEPPSPSLPRARTIKTPERRTESYSGRPKLQRTNSSGSMDYNVKKMHHGMGSDYGGSEDEGYHRSRTTNRSRAASRQRSHSRNRAYSNAYAPPKSSEFTDVTDIMGTPGYGRERRRSPEPFLRRSGSSPDLHRQPAKECHCCLEQFQPSMTTSLICQHVWCSSCLSDLTQLALNSEDFWPPKCCSTEISQRILLNNLDKKTKAKCKLALDKQPPSILKCPACSESFSDLRLLTRHHGSKHSNPEPSPAGDELNSTNITSPEQAPISKDVDSDTSRSSISSRASEESATSTTITEPDSNPNQKVPQIATPPSPALDSNFGLKKTHQQWKFHQLPSIIIIFLCKKCFRFLGFQTTAWFVLVLATAATAITTTYSIQGPPQDPPPQIGDSNYYSLLSQSIIAICSLYYLMVPYLRGDEELPVRALFYVYWVLSLVGAVTAPLIYAKEWSKSVWAGFGSALAQIAATAFLFEHVKSSERKQSQRKNFQSRAHIRV